MRGRCSAPRSTCRQRNIRPRRRSIHSSSRASGICCRKPCNSAVRANVPAPPTRLFRRYGLVTAGRGSSPEVEPHSVEIRVNDWRDIKRKQLRQQQAACNTKAQGPTGIRSHSRSQRDGKRTHHRCHGRHHDGPKADQGGLKDRLFRACRRVLALALESEIDHHDGVLLDDADQHDHANKSVKRDRHSEDPKCQKCANSRRWQP